VHSGAAKMLPSARVKGLVKNKKNLKNTPRQTAMLKRNRTNRWLLISLLLAAAPSFPFEIKVQVLTNDGQPINNAVVYALDETKPLSEPNQSKAVMDQRQKMFVPHVLAVPVGSLVEFPNNDEVNHYVYSFSNAKKIQLKLFKRDTEKHSVLLDKAGLITLGCNIHDTMLGYIFVAPSPYVGVTDNTGITHFTLTNAGEFTLMLWHERINEVTEKLAKKIIVTDTQNTFEIRLTRPLKPERKYINNSDIY
jgi:plastocyanin